MASTLRRNAARALEYMQTMNDKQLLEMNQVAGFGQQSFRDRRATPPPMPRPPPAEQTYDFN